MTYLENKGKEQWGTRLGYIITQSMTMVGLGNIWRFPYLVGAYGGAAFLIPYLIFLFLVGIPGDITEVVLGKMTGKSTTSAYREVHPKLTGTGYIQVLISTGVVSYYVVIVTWIVVYIGFTLKGTYWHTNPVELWESFRWPQAWSLVLYSGIILALSAWVNLSGIQKGLEKVSTILGVPLFVILVILACRSITLPGSKILHGT